MDDRTLQRNFRILSKRHRQLVSSYLDRVGLYFGQPRLLFLIQDNPGITRKALAIQSESLKETISISIKRLSKANLVIQVENPLDKRIQHLYLSEKGIEVANLIHADFNRLNDSMVAGLSQQDKETLNTLFEKMLLNLKEFND
jgi:DNA-binding MarR family transcriptional regulator